MSNNVNGVNTRINPVEIRGIISELPNVKTDLDTIKINLSNVDEPLEESWIGTARDAYVLVTAYTQLQLEGAGTVIGGIYNESQNTCDERDNINQDASIAAEGNS